MWNQPGHKKSRNKPAPNRLMLVTAASLCAATTGAARAQVTQTVLHSFEGTDVNAYPTAPLLVDSTGPAGSVRGLYGVAGEATAFNLAPPKNGKTNWKENVLRTFHNKPGQPYYAEEGGLFALSKRITPDTALYGTTAVGGKNKDTCLIGFGYYGCGTVYSLTGHNLAIVWDFTGGSDGGQPDYGVVADKTGALYTGTTYGGGASGCGTIVKLSPPAEGQTAWTETTIWTFTNVNDGCLSSGLIIDGSGAIYGEAAEGGADGDGDGTVFKLIPPKQGQTAWTEQTLWTFQNSGDGDTPYGVPAIGTDGVIYGTTASGGSNGNGIVFALTPPPHGSKAWSEQILWNFTGGADGSTPYAGVIVDKAGALYGTTFWGGAGNGTAFQLAPPGNGNSAWTEKALWQFTGGSDGGNPIAPLTADKAGTLYGTTEEGGAGAGVAFSLSGTGFVP